MAIDEMILACVEREELDAGFHASSLQCLRVLVQTHRFRLPFCPVEIPDKSVIVKGLDELENKRMSFATDQSSNSRFARFANPGQYSGAVGSRDWRRGKEEEDRAHVAWVNRGI